MARQRVQLSADIGPGADGKPPSEFRIFKAGDNATTKGLFLFDEAAALLVLAAAKDYGNDFCLDYWHGMIGAKYAPNPAEAGKAAGWFTLELRGGELWAAGVRWTPAAAQYLTNLEYRFISQTFDHEEDGRICELLNVALCNLPANKNLTPLMASRTETTMTADQLKTLAKRLGLPETATEAQCLAVTEIGGVKLAKLAKLSKLPATATVTEVLAALDKEAEPATPAGVKCTGCKADMAEDSKFCAKCGVAVPAEGNDDDEIPEAAKAEMSRLDKENRETRAELDRMKSEQQLARFNAEAETYKALAHEPGKLGPALAELAAKAPEAKKVIDSILTKANAALSASDLLIPAGRGGEHAETSAAGRLKKLAVELQKNDATLSDEQAQTKALSNNPKLYDEYQAERAAAQRPAA